MEKYVVVPFGVNYKGGIGYTGHILKVLQFPEGPYTRKVAAIFVQQAKTVEPKMRFKIVDYIK